MKWPPIDNPYYCDDYACIIHGDCRDILPLLEPVDLVLTDPPYGISAGKSPVGSMGLDWGLQSWDKTTADEAVKISTGKAKKIIIWGGNYYVLPPSRGWLAWDKKQPMEWYSTAHFEMAWTNLDQNAHAFRMSQVEAYGQMQKEHPTQKPIALMIWCINEADKHGSSDTILDPFMGSGTTLVAAKNLNRKSIGIELEEKYCAIAVKRLAQEVLPLC